MQPPTLAGTPLDAYHVCAFFNSRDEEYATLNPFLQEAFASGEKVMHIVDPTLLADHRARLTASGIDAAHCEACGQLELVSWRDAYLDDTGTFDKDRMLAAVDHLTGTGRDAGFSRLRVIGNMNWVFDDIEVAPKLIEYEAEVNEVLAHNRQPAICVYDMAKLSGAMLMDLLRTHPMTLINGVVQENPFFTPPSEMIQELKRRRSVEAASGASFEEHGR
ncbi:MEDS domain-containing protein [Caballeronia sp. LZ062]|uniref:MEDS domain-containing protein n=1 Tax=unclassified Caballeronia TaxID=2646786 RepID=UPI002856BB0C|nr:MULTISPECIES: MEDS domain-containing protein [unclassified Caballeronia]MDR5857681.1 MEDS domain-containing protein [Caballeronia sp. LZ050]MDR5869231.1 MEDS domain-containing protein [Caballeronia sp. LZ062]